MINKNNILKREVPILPDQQTIKLILTKYRGKILKEVHSANDLLSLLMKGTHRKWTRSEVREIKVHLTYLSKTIPALMVFLLPGGFILLPLLIEILDRRKKSLLVTLERRNREERN